MRRPELVGLAVLLLGLAAALTFGFRRPSHLVLVSWPASPPGVELTPRLDALATAARHAARGGGRSTVDTLAAEASQAGWVVVEGTGGPEAVLDGVLDALVEGQRTAVVVRLDAVGPAALDDQLGRVLDGIAAVLAPSRTLYLVERSDELYAVGPGQNRVESPADGLSAHRDLAWTLRLR